MVLRLFNMIILVTIVSAWLPVTARKKKISTKLVTKHKFMQRF